MKFLLLLTVIFSLPSFSESTKDVMNSALRAYVKLIPYMSSDLKFTDPNTDEKINSYLVDLEKAFSNAKHTGLSSDSGFKPSLETIVEHLKDTRDAFNQKHKYFAKSRLKATASICMSCHTQLKEKNGNFSRSIQRVSRDSFNSDFEYAEFLYLVRNFRKSQKYYEKYINEKLTENSKMKDLGLADDVFDRQLIAALRRIVSIHTKIKLDPKKAKSVLDRYVAHGKSSKHLKTEARELRSQVSKWSKSSALEISSSTELEDFIQKYLKPIENDDSTVRDGSRDIDLLVTSGVLTRYLRKKSKASDRAKVLYWLSISQRQLDFNIFYDLSELYLEECIRSFPKSSYAKMCFKEYEDNIKFGYTGSAGTRIPGDVKEKLKALSKLLK